MVRRRIFIALSSCVFLVSCDLDSRKQAVDEVIRFGMESPFEILSVNEGHSYLAVADSALADYNRIFDYLPKSDDVDSARYYYNKWMRLILTDASFSSIEDLVYSLEADTLVAKIAVRRPELSEFDRVIVSQLGEIDTEVLNNRITRAKLELQIRDTLELRVIAGPRIVSWSSAVYRRDSVDATAGEVEVPVGETQPAQVAMLSVEQPDPPVPAREEFAVPAREEFAVPAREEFAVPAREEFAVPDPADSTIQFWVIQNANVRVGPGMAFDVSTTQAAGTFLIADSLFDGWYHVQDERGKIDGFIASSLVSLAPVTPVEADDNRKASAAPREAPDSSARAPKPERGGGR